MDTDYTNDLALLTNTPVQAESLLHSLEQAAGGIGLYVNSDKTVLTILNKLVPSSFNVEMAPYLKLIDYFTYLSNNISSTKIDSIYIGKAWIANN